MSTALDLDLGRLSLAGSPYGGQEANQSAQSQAHVRTASSLERSSNSAAAPTHSDSNSTAAAATPSAAGLQPHQVMQPPLHQGPPPQVRLKEPQRRRGIVKFFNSLKGFGFVVDNDPTALGGQEVFCHFSAISGKGGFRSLAEGEEVEYELVQGPKGFQAANLTGPGGRSVVGDPKARMQKPPAYLPLAPFAMPIGGPYLDPYHPAHAQHAGMYAGSPYTQHVLYVPAAAAASMQHQQYAYAPLPLGGVPGGMQQPSMPPVAMRHQASGSFGGGASTAAGVGAGQSPFAAPQYQSYAAPSSIAAGIAGAGPGMNGVGSAGADRYNAASPLGRMAGGMTGAPFGGSPQQPAFAGDYSQQPQRTASATGSTGSAFPLGGVSAGLGASGPNSSVNNTPNPAAFSPPGGGFIGLPGGNGGMPAFGGFAPFSPPAFNHAPLYPPPTGQQQGPQQPHQLAQQQYPNDYSSHSQTHTPQPASSTTPAPGQTPASSALFGSAPAPIGSRSGTPAAGGGRSTPALGNGSLGNDAWKAPTAGSNAGSLYASSNGGDAAHH